MYSGILNKFIKVEIYWKYDQIIIEFGYMHANKRRISCPAHEFIFVAILSLGT